MRKLLFICSFFGLVSSLLLLPSCGKDEQRGIGGYLYVAEEILLKNDENGKTDYEKRIENLKYSGGYLYYCRGGNTLYRHSMDSATVLDGGTEGAGDELILAAGGKSRLIDYAVDREGEVYCFLGNTTMGKNYLSVVKDGVLRKLGRNGAADYEVEFTVPSQKTNSSQYCLQMTVDEEERVFLLLEDTIYIVSEEGQISCQIDVSAYRSEYKGGTEELLKGGEGRIYYCVDSSLYGGWLAVYEIKEEKDSFRAEQINGNGWEKQGIYNGKLYGSPQGLLYSGGDRILRRYLPEKDSWKELLRWSDSNLTEDAGEILWFSEENMVVNYTDMGLESGQRLYLLTRKEADQVPEKEELVMACRTGINQSLEQCVAAFNRASSRYHITVEIYQGEEGKNRLDAELVSSHPPDLLDIMNMDIVKYADKQALEDLNPYLENSEVLNREIFLDNVLDGYTMDGKLVCIPRQFDWDTVWCRISQAGNRSGWTMEELIDFAGQYPEYRLFNYNSLGYLLKCLCNDYVMENFISWEKGECSFDSDEFHSFMEWIIGRSNEEGDAYGGGAVPEDILLVRKSIFSPYNLLNCEIDFGEEITAAGYPSVCGQVRHRAQVYDSVCIMAKSRHKEGAWEFIEYLLGQFQEERGEYLYNFSTRRDLLEKMMERYATPQYMVDENGDPVMTQEGPRFIIMGERLQDGKVVNYYSIPQEELDDMMAIIEGIDFTPRGGVENEVLLIIEEEMESYLKGDKTLKEATEIIQNRARLLVRERQR